MPRPKDFTPAEERKRKELARKYAKKPGIRSPWGLATWQVRRSRKSKRARKVKKRG